jgi:hypothetical protein
MISQKIRGRRGASRKVRAVREEETGMCFEDHRKKTSERDDKE